MGFYIDRNGSYYIGDRAHWEDVEVPERPSSQHVYMGGLWTYTAQHIKSLVTQKRWEVETGGITLPTGVQVATGTDDQNRVTSVLNRNRGIPVFDFKAASGWVSATYEDVEAIDMAIARHVQACFSAERAHHEAIDALEDQYKGDAAGLHSALESYDVTKGWPSNHQNIAEGGDQ